jgi:hypothetical protein
VTGADPIVVVIKARSAWNRLVELYGRQPDRFQRALAVWIQGCSRVPGEPGRVALEMEARRARLSAAGAALAARWS